MTGVLRMADIDQTAAIGSRSTLFIQSVCLKTQIIQDVLLIFEVGAIDTKHTCGKILSNLG